MAAGNHSPEYLAESKVPLSNAFSLTAMVLEIISTGSRVWIKGRPSSQRRLAFDDYFIIWATVRVYTGYGRHVDAITTEQLENLLLADYIGSHIYNFAIVSTKLSVLALYYRIFAIARFRLLVVATSVCVVTWFVVMELILVLGCRPIQAWWNIPMAAAAACVDKIAFSYSTSILNLIFDLCILTMPIPIILRLQASMEKRIGLCFLFSMGLGTCAISAARLSVVVDLKSKDITWDQVNIGILSVWEPCSSILCANLPLVYKPLVDGLRKIHSTITNPRSQSRDPSGQLSSSCHDWTRLDGRAFKNHATLNITATGGHLTESDVIEMSGITVEHDFKQEIHRQ
ncbi:hypothetical protein K445DRAFT_75982 [Daldinia sp. EC12]|nr:hypothetical protein K445DRAFT_75982 [Daldinia sp. EC12]